MRSKYNIINFNLNYKIISKITKTFFDFSLISHNIIIVNSWEEI